MHRVSTPDEAPGFLPPCRRSRASVIESDEDDENVELVRRGVTKVDCKRGCGDSSVS